MKSIRAVIAACALLAACGDSKPAPSLVASYEFGTRISAAPDTGAQVAGLWAALGGQSAHVVIADDETIAAAALAARPPSTNTPSPPFVVIASDTLLQDNGALRFDALVVPDTGAAVAIDLALLACNGIAPPNDELPIGARYFTAANLAAGGAAVPAAGDPIVALLRMQHAALLTTQPSTDEVHPIGFLQCRDNAWHARVRAEVGAAAKRYPQLGLTSRSAGDDTTKQLALLRELTNDGCRAILISTDEPATLTTAIDEARARGVAVIVLDPWPADEHGSCSVGSDATTVGQAAGYAIKQLLPGGGTVIELHGQLPATVAEQRHRGLAAALGLR